MPFRRLAQNSSLQLLGTTLPLAPHGARPSWRPRKGSVLLHGRINKGRNIHLSTVLLPPVVFAGLLGTLWLFKCTMMVLAQSRMIYMPSLARRERIADYARQCGGIHWVEERTRASDGTELALAVAALPLPAHQLGAGSGGEDSTVCHTYVLYCQGNVSSIPPRLPDLSWVLRATNDSHAVRTGKARCTMVCLSYRGYWTSTGHPSERGINEDAWAAVRWIVELHRKTYGIDQRVTHQIVVWGQSIGAGIATNLAARMSVDSSNIDLDGMILETPFLSIRAMLSTLYPQNWLPYKRLWPFLWNHLDSWKNMGEIASTLKSKRRPSPDILILEAGRDELVPVEHGEKLLQRCLDVGLVAEKRTVRGAYHNEAVVRAGGKRAVADFIIRQIQKLWTRRAGRPDKSPELPLSPP